MDVTVKYRFSIENLPGSEKKTLHLPAFFAFSTWSRQIGANRRKQSMPILACPFHAPSSIQIAHPLHTL